MKNLGRLPAILGGVREELRRRSILAPCARPGAAFWRKTGMRRTNLDRIGGRARDVEFAECALQRLNAMAEQNNRLVAMPKWMLKAQAAKTKVRCSG